MQLVSVSFLAKPGISMIKVEGWSMSYLPNVL
jgi:hypothetical protein